MLCNIGWYSHNQEQFVTFTLKTYSRCKFGKGIDWEQIFRAISLYLFVNCIGNLAQFREDFSSTRKVGQDRKTETNFIVQSDKILIKDYFALEYVIYLRPFYCNRLSRLIVKCFAIALRWESFRCKRHCPTLTLWPRRKQWLILLNVKNLLAVISLGVYRRHEDYCGMGEALSCQQ